MTQLKNRKLGNHLFNNSWGKSLAQFEYILLCLVIIVLPTFEAPKHIFWVLYFISAIARLINNKSLLNWKWHDLFFGLWLISALASTLGAGMQNHHEWKGFKDLFIYSSTAWLVYRSNYSLKQLTNLLIVAIIAVTIPLLWGLWLHLGPAHKQYLELKSVGHVNHSAIYLTIIFGISLSITIHQWASKTVFKKLFFTGISGLLLSSIVISQSRAALAVALLVSTFLFLFLIDRIRIKLMCLIFLGLFLSGITLVNPVILQKHNNNVLANNILSGRSEVWNVSLEAARWHPIFGLGMDNWKLITPEKIKESVEQRGQIYRADSYFFPNHSHNLYLTILVERGIVGLNIFVFALLAWGIQLIRTYQACKSQNKIIIWGSSLSAYTVAIGIGAVNTTIHHEHGLLTALCLGIFLAATQSKFSETH